MKLSEQFHDQSQKCRISNVFANFLVPRVRHIKEAELINEEGYQAGLESGEVVFARYIVGHLIWNAYHQGKNLQRVRETV